MNKKNAGNNAQDICGCFCYLWGIYKPQVSPAYMLRSPWTRNYSTDMYCPTTISLSGSITYVITIISKAGYIKPKVSAGLDKSRVSDKMLWFVIAG